jgi:hypothetical protein
MFHQKTLYDTRSLPGTAHSIANSSLRPRSNVPLVLNSKTHARGFKVQVAKMLKDDVDKIDFHAMSSKKTTDSTVVSLRSVKAIDVPVENQDQGIEQVEKDNLQGTEQEEEEDVSLIIASTKTLLEVPKNDEIVVTTTPGLSHFYSDYEDVNPLEFEEGEYTDPRYSFLNPHEPFVKVAPLMLGKALAKNGTPLDLSCVPKRTTAGPMYHDDDQDILTKDELKVYSLLEYELNRYNGSLNDDHYYGVQENREADVSISTRSIFNKIFHRASKEEKYLLKYPWCGILNRIDNPINENEDAGSGQTTLEFERNNTDMFPLNFTPLTESVSDSEKKHAVAYASSYRS